ncbi:MAG: DinB family protein [Acidimicrobiales bacterium]
MDACAECGFDYDLGMAEAASTAILDGTAEMAAILGKMSTAAHRRPTAGTWSPLEYGCHVRDVLTVQRERALLARREDTPTVAPMGRDERGEHDGYADQDAGDVAIQLAQLGRLFSNVLDRLQTADWERTMIYNYPSSAERSLRWLAIHTQHEVEHHLLDIKQQPA